MSTTPKSDFDVEIKKCDITKPYEAIVSDFSKKLIAHISLNSKFKESYISEIVEKLEDTNATLSSVEGANFSDFMEENREFFDKVIQRYKGHFPAWVQFSVSDDSMDMTQEDHVLYEDGAYKSFDKIKEYVQTRIEFEGGVSSESLETPSEYIDTNYVDTLLADENLKEHSKKQLENIKDLLIKNPNSKLNKDRLIIQNGFVIIDGFGLPIDTTRQNYSEMSKENSDKLYPDFAIASLNFTAELTGNTFDRGTLDKNSLVKGKRGKLGYEEILNTLNTDSNKSILKSLSTIVDVKGYIPMGIDKNGYVIYADLSSGTIRFDCGYGRYDYDICLVPSNGNKTPLSGGVSE